VLTIRDTDSSTVVPPTDAPLQVTTLQRFGIHTQPTRIVLTFSGPLDAATATNRANYTIFGANGVAIPIASAIYDAASSTVTLRPSRQLSVFRSFRLIVRGTGAGAISSPDGTLLDGNRDNTPGGDYIATINAASLVQPTNKAKAKVVAKSGRNAKLTTKWASHLTGRNSR